MKLNASRRDLVGRRARRLLHEGRVPAIVYGHHADSTPLALDAREFAHVFREAGRTHLVDLVVEGSGPKAGTKVLIKSVQMHPRHLGPIHVDLQAVSMREKLQVDVPVIAVGESPIVKAGEGETMVVTHSLKVECLPANIPEAFEVDISGLTAIGDQVRVGELPMRDGVTILADPEEVLVKVQPVRELAAELEAVEAAEAAEAAEGVEAEEGAEGAEAERAEESAEAEPPASEGSDGGSADEAESKAEDRE
jgi:large subunit ribosomal protein L25